MLFETWQRSPEFLMKQVQMADVMNETVPDALEVKRRAAALSIDEQGKLTTNTPTLFNAYEGAYEGVMNEQINSMRQQEKAVQAFGRKADKLAAWCDAADAYASRPVPDLKTLADAEAALKECEGKVDEAASKEGKLTKLSAHAAGLQGAAKDRAGARFNELEGKVAQSSSALQEKLAALKEAKEVQEAADSLRLECAQKAEEINAWVDATAKELLVTKTTAESTSDVERALEKIGEHAAGIEERRVDLDALKQALAAAGVPSGECNPYSRFDNDELAASLDEVEELCQSRRDAINEEAKRQAGLDDMRKAFADNASSLMKFLHENGSAYNSALNDKLEDYAEQALARHAATRPGQPLFMYLAYTVTHSPDEAPKRYTNQYPKDWIAGRRVYAGMASALDESVGNITAALKRLGMWEDTLLVFSSE